MVAAMVLLVVAAPNSIAGTQGAAMLGGLFWLLRLFIWPKPKLNRTPIDYPMFAFFLLSAFSSFFSYEPAISIAKLRSAAFFLIVYLFAENVRSLPLLRLLTVLLIAACMVNVIYTFGQFAVGRGVKVEGVSAGSPLSQARLTSRSHNQAIPIVSGDTLETIDGVPFRDLDELVRALELSPTNNSPVKIGVYRVEWIATLEVPRGQLLPGDTPTARLGIQSWRYGRDRRATGFYGHWTTYAEALQLIGSLAFGLLIALPKKIGRNGLLLALAIAGIAGALLLSVTRASWLSFLLSAILISVLGLSRRAVLVIGLAAVPLVLAGLFILQQKRNVGFFDSKDDSIAWRQKIWREGANLLGSSPRHLLVGIGMDSIKSHWRAWGLFENGKLPMGHMHSDYLQIALERGIPALLVWLWLLGAYGWVLWRTHSRVPAENWIERGIVLGALGGLLGFMTSGVVHYNWGDSEVVMILYLIMGLSLVVWREFHLTGDT